MIREKEIPKEIVIDLNGSEGNAFYLLGFAEKLSKSIGCDCSEVLGDMKSGDYENLLQVFDSYFGDFVVLKR